MLPQAMNQLFHLRGQGVVTRRKNVPQTAGVDGAHRGAIVVVVSATAFHTKLRHPDSHRYHWNATLDRYKPRQFGIDSRMKRDSGRHHADELLFRDHTT